MISRAMAQYEVDVKSLRAHATVAIGIVSDCELIEVPDLLMKSFNIGSEYTISNSSNRCGAIRCLIESDFDSDSPFLAHNIHCSE